MLSNMKIYELKRQNSDTLLHISYQLHRHFVIKRCGAQIAECNGLKTPLSRFWGESCIMLHHLLNGSWLVAFTSVIRQIIKSKRCSLPCVSVPAEKKGNCEMRLKLKLISVICSHVRSAVGSTYETGILHVSVSLGKWRLSRLLLDLHLRLTALPVKHLGFQFKRKLDPEGD